MDITSAYNIVDTETTGLHPLKDRIIDIAILRVENGKVVREYNSLINPHIRINDHITRITGITQEHINKAPEFGEVKNEIKELLTDTVFIAHNARFDYAFVKNEFLRYQDSIKLKTLCTVRLSRMLFPKLKSHSLENLINEFGIKVNQRHRALADTKAVFQFLQTAQAIKGNESVEKAFTALKKKPSIPRYLTNKDFDDLPESPGVYIFWADDIALYVGKSVNIKDRVRSHFTSDHATSKDLKISSQIKKIETITTAGELGALLLESQLVKKLFPLYNKQLRREQTPVTVTRGQNGKGYFGAKLNRDNTALSDHHLVLSTYRSIKQAKEDLYQLAEEFRLCPKLLALEKSKDTCFNYQLNKCSGACINKEEPVRYNVRFVEAFAKSQIQKWPFTGTVALVEENGLNKESHIVNNWCYLGTIKTLEDFEQISENTDFDYDMYKILKKFIFSKGKNLKILDVNIWNHEH